MADKSYIVATLKAWNLKVYNEILKHYPGQWHLITSPNDLTPETIKSINPAYIFFPHWSHIVPKEILDIATCICFHETDLPYGRGGSPIQNLIAKGHKETVISALKMTEELDAGPIYLKKPLSLEGRAEDIFNRSAKIVAEMIKTIITDNPEPEEQAGEPVYFTRRKPSESEILNQFNNTNDLYDHIRMLDAETYPKAFLNNGEFRFEFSKPSIKDNNLIAEVHITRSNGVRND